MIETRFKKASNEILIPQDWIESPLIGVTTKIGSGATPTGGETSYLQTGISLIRSLNVHNNQFIYDRLAHINEIQAAELDNVTIEYQDVLINITGASVARCCIVPDDVLPARVNQHVSILRADTKKIEPALLTLILTSPFYQKALLKKSKGNGGTREALNKKMLQNFIIALPQNHYEQEKIASALSDIDDLISTLEKLIEKKRSIKQGAMQELLSGKRRLAGFTDKWVNKEIGKIGLTYNGLSGKTKEDFGKGDSYYITFLNILKNPILNEDIFENVNVTPTENQNKVIAGDLFFNTSSETPEEVGFCATIEHNIEDLYINSFCFGFRLTDPEVSNVFLAYFFRNTGGRKLMSTLANGVTRFNLSKNKMKRAYITIPSTKKEQQAIANVLKDMDSEITSLESRLSKYRDIKQGMMQQLLTGKIRLI